MVGSDKTDFDLNSGHAQIIHQKTYNHDFSHDSSKNNIRNASDLLVSVSVCEEANKAKIINLAYEASEELRQMAQDRQSLWSFDVNKGYETLNRAEHHHRFAALDPTLEEIIQFIAAGRDIDLLNFTQNVECRAGNELSPSGGTENREVDLEFEASRASGVVFRDATSLVDMFMDVDKWSAAFSNIVSKAINLGVVLPAQHGNLDGMLKVMMVELHLPSPLMKSRKMYFARHARQIDSNTWVVADVSLENSFPIPTVTCQRRPSGCLIQSLPGSLSMVTWVEHNAVECNDTVRGTLEGRLLTPGLAFSANRWISSLERQFDRIANIEAQCDSLSSSINNNNGKLVLEQGGIQASRSCLLKVADEMVRKFNENMSSSMENLWKRLPVDGAEDIRIKTSLEFNQQVSAGFPLGAAVTIATSVWLPIPPEDVFNFIRLPDNRCKWDVLSSTLEFEAQEIVCISSPRNSTDSVSVVAFRQPANRRWMMSYLQESFSDSTCYNVVYAPVDIPTMSHMIQGGSADSVRVSTLPSGFSILPQNANSILTIMFHVMDQTMTAPHHMIMSSTSALTAYTLMKHTIHRIHAALHLPSP